jgi:hypothetical protein
MSAGGGGVVRLGAMRWSGRVHLWLYAVMAWGRMR